MWKRLCLAALYCMLGYVLVLAAPASALAHATATSAVTLDLQGDDVAAELQLPLDQLGLALHEPFVDGAVVLPAFDAVLRRYLEGHVHLTAADGRPYAMAIRSLSTAPTEAGDVVRAEVFFTAPVGAPPGSPTLADDAILHQVVTHRTLVSLRRDFDHAQLGSTSRVVGVLGYAQKSVVIDRHTGSRFEGMRAVFGLGVRHIAEGTDHILFLLVLLLSAPLLVAGRRWGAARPLKTTVKHVVAVVSSFTLGHCVSLAAGALGWLNIPSRPVELAISVSIMVTAVHALRPLFAGREPLVAAAFGLVHGLAFATALRELGFHGSTLGLSLLAFNLGIEAMQLAIVLVVVPWLVLLAKTPWYGAVRVGGAALGGVASAGWVVERVSGHANLVTRAVASLSEHGVVAVVLLACAALAATRGTGAAGSDRLRHRLQ